MTTARPTAIDDHGDRFPGALPAPATASDLQSQDSLLRMHAGYVYKVNAVLAAGRDSLAHELAQSFEEESGTPYRSRDDRSA